MRTNDAVKLPVPSCERQLRRWWEISQTALGGGDGNLGAEASQWLDISAPDTELDHLQLHVDASNYLSKFSFEGDGLFQPSSEYIRRGF